MLKNLDKSLLMMLLLFALNSCTEEAIVETVCLEEDGCRRCELDDDCEIQCLEEDGCIPCVNEDACSEDLPFCGSGGYCQAAEACVDDDDCESFLVCDQIARGCHIPETFCNLESFCQRRPGCRNNSECPDGMICDTNTGVCIDRLACTKDLHCNLGFICDLENQVCVSGCHDRGDCPDDEICFEGQCRVGICEYDFDCPYGQFCLNYSCCEPGDCCDGECSMDRPGFYCDSCQNSDPATNPHPCGVGRNYCLVDTSTSAQGVNFCGVDCSSDQPCPSGYGCHDILILTQETCYMENDPETGEPCESRACPSSTCNSGFCIIGEGEEQGFCTCEEDSDCPLDRCNPTFNVCEISLKSCIPTSRPCPTISCRSGGGDLGYCFIGRNCAPDEGFSCSQLLEQ